MPFGYLITTGVMAAYVLFAVAPPRPRRSSPVRLSFWLGYLVNELPFIAFYVLAASTALAIGQGDIATPVGWIGLGLAVPATGGHPASMASPTANDPEAVIDGIEVFATRVLGR